MFCPALGTTLDFSVSRPPAEPLGVGLAAMLPRTAPRKELAREETPVWGNALVPSKSVDGNT